MIEKTIKNFPQVSYLYLRKGEGKPILEDYSEKVLQQNMFGTLFGSSAKEPELPPYPNYDEDTDLKILNNSVNRLSSLIEMLISEIKKLNYNLNQKP